jgi:drug/metabolite transporter (DMT)-like permease
VASERGSRTVAIGLSVAASLAWATYYIFVLAISPGTRPSAIMAYPFLFGGAAYLIWASTEHHFREFWSMWLDPQAWVRTSLLVVMQLSVLAATYLTGPVDASLLSLIGDVVATPLVVAFILGAHRDQIRTRWFAAGVTLSLAGGTMAIVGGRSLSGIPAAGWLVVPTVPIAVAFYFLLCARANERSPASVVVGQSMLASGLVLVLLAPAIPGGWAGLVAVGPVSSWAILAALGLTSFFLAPVIYFIAIARAGLVIPPMLMTGIPVFTLLLSATVLHLGLPLIAALGIPVAVAGGLLILRGGASHPSPVPPPTP